MKLISVWREEYKKYGTLPNIFPQQYKNKQTTMKKYKTDEYETQMLIPDNPEYREESSFINSVIYRRVPKIRENINDCLRKRIIDEGINVDWNTEEIFTEDIKGRKKCEDRTKITLKVKII